ncbi:PLP-dependent aspartate aminotransferase family protein [Malonomonas rubra]|uniref:trans-sulfuration enzyme family protein n=1 Tax=Malonomonas rubra TaxID=57040 RepID=UPI0026EA2A36|nr:PLP-dependent aspartate aminotransferase family protein [Malonomonas rubra]
MAEKNYRVATQLVHQRQDRDPYTGAATVPIYQASTYHHPEGKPGSYDYARSGNPSREQVEQAVALLEGARYGFACASGMAAIGTALSLLKSGDHLIAPEDLYGGSYRYLTQLLPDLGIEVSYVDFTAVEQIAAAINPRTRGIFIETPSNPSFLVSDLRAIVALAKQHQLLTLLDNTFMTPLLQRTIELGVDVVIHSATKFLGGHSDLLAGIVVTDDEHLAKRLKRFHNGFGAVLGPFDCFLVSRGLKTLKLRLDAAQQSALTLAERLREHRAVKRVIYPGLDDFAQRKLHFSQAGGAGAVLSFELKDAGRVSDLLRDVHLPIIAPSLGGVETILTHCWSMSHAAMPVEVKQRLGIGAGLLRISVGIEDVEDLWEDFYSALN